MNLDYRDRIVELTDKEIILMLIDNYIDTEEVTKHKHLDSEEYRKADKHYYAANLLRKLLKDIDKV